MHRDIKPANVIITDSGAVKVMDFGIARALHGAQSTMTQTGMVMGTPQYLSPEQALGKAVDHRSDLYATGCLLYELLALRPPFTGETPLSVVYQHVQDIPVPPVRGRRTAVPPELDGLVMRSLAKDPDDRFQSAEEMRGLVQYGLQMLYDQGGHTGTWNTGPVDVHDGRRTPADGHRRRTAAMRHPGTATPRRARSCRRMNPDDGAYAGGQHGGGGRGKMWLFVLLALIAIGAGVAFALQAANDDGGRKKTPASPSTSLTPSPTPSSPEPTDEETEETEEPDNSSGGQTWPTSEPHVEPDERADRADPGADGHADVVRTRDGRTDGRRHDRRGDDGGTTGEPTTAARRTADGAATTAARAGAPRPGTAARAAAGRPARRAT